MDIEEIIAQAAAAATANAAKGAAKDKKKLQTQAQVTADGPIARRAAAAEKSRVLLEAARAKEVKQGLDIVEELLRDISPNVLRAITRDDADRLLNSGVRLVIHFSKTDASSTIPSFTVTRGSVKTERNFHKNTIEQWASSEALFLDRYRQQGGNTSISSHHELMLELIEVNKENKRLRTMLMRAGEKALHESQHDAPMGPGSTEGIVAETPARAIEEMVPLSEAQAEGAENIGGGESASS
jgi:hypothetical protein